MRRFAIALSLGMNASILGLLLLGFTWSTKAERVFEFLYPSAMSGYSLRHPLSGIGAGTQAHIATTAVESGGYLISRNSGWLEAAGGYYFDGSNYLTTASAASSVTMAGGSVTVFADGGLTSTPGGNAFTPTTRLVVSSAGAVTIADLATTGAATGKTVVCADTNGKLYRSSAGDSSAN